MAELSDRIAFKDVDWTQIPLSPGVYVIYDHDEVIYVGMSGRNGKGTLRSRLRDHCSGQIVNMFAQYLFLARIQPMSYQRITHPRDAQRACRDYIADRCSFRYSVANNAADARRLEKELKAELKPTLNP
jgi:excinuclease UvrABC nuclease subunit